MKKKKKKEKPRVVATDNNWCLLSHSAFRPDLSHRLYPDPFSNASSTLRAARAHDADLLIYSFTVPL